MTPEERFDKVWRGIAFGPGWEDRLRQRTITAIRAAVAEAVAGEREACAVCAALYLDDSDGYKPVQRQTALAIAAAIRSRGAGEGEGEIYHTKE